ncbi:hypothetical protein IGB42_00522 [Andreprevotia sp. IGB-42]|uniref:DUF4401 domain-containing protein n=1 Tax=Andreprevotia sp. IGB-42 TaxID=2497473 RepID=UPI00135A798F|nr:DUF4401 domain-containing protein [Andreprevotia sp. IGB-42]KAF0815441.1 hypothetical protein IGB42_00522 [Andreprevotia sp. IGB-42]
MTTPTRFDEVVAALRASGQLAADAVLPVQEDSMPWPVLVLQAVAAWVAAALLTIAVVVAAGISGSNVLYIACGVVLLLGAGGLLRTSKVYFLTQIAIPTVIAGAALVIAGVDPGSSTTIWMFGFAALLFAVFPNVLLRFIAAVTLLAVLWYWLTPGPFFAPYSTDVPAPTSGMAWRFAAGAARDTVYGLALWWLWVRPVGADSPWLPVRHALLVVALLAIGGWADLFIGRPGGADPYWGMGWQQPVVIWALRLLGLLPLLVAVVHDVRRNPGLHRWLTPLAILLPFCALAPGVALAGLLVWLGLGEGRKVLLWLGVAAGVFGFADFYGRFPVPLPDKGLLLLAIGLLLVGNWAWLRRRPA